MLKDFNPFPLSKINLKLMGYSGGMDNCTYHKPQPEIASHVLLWWSLELMDTTFLLIIGCV